MKPESFSPPLTEKERAIAKALPRLHDHHDLISRVRTCLPVQPNPAPSYRPPQDEDDELFWEVLANRNRQKYRLDAVTESLERLRQSGQPRAMAILNAVYCVLIEPWDRYLTEAQRLRYARAGLRYLATEIPGDMPDYQEPGFSNRDARNQEIARLLEFGLTTRQIAQQLHCSTVTIQAVKEGRRVRHGVLETMLTPTEKITD